MQPIENKILSRVYGRGRGWAFTKVDFVAEFGDDLMTILATLQNEINE